MGREVRKVPANWGHPMVERYGRVDSQPMFDQQYSNACAEWLEDFDRIRRDEMTGFERKFYTNAAHWASENPAPDQDYYRPWNDDDATWFQLWETVSEGTPVTPPFETKEELISYLAEHGDFWDQKRCKTPEWTTLWGGVFGVSGWGREQAERFVLGPGWAPSLVIADGKVMDGVQAFTEFERNENGSNQETDN